jgi:hypothetical protein
VSIPYLVQHQSFTETWRRIATSPIGFVGNLGKGSGAARPQ